MKHSGLLLILFAAGIPEHASAFMEEGGNAIPVVRNGFTRCRTLEDLREAEYYGCNPWNDGDANFSLEAAFDEPKSSVHYDMTYALAIAAGFNPCAAYVVALYDEATDAASDYDQLFWAPFPEGVSLEACGTIFAESLLTPFAGVSELGAYVAPDFTFRGEDEASYEVARESMTFHFNPDLDAFLSPDSNVVCDASGASDPPPQPHQDVIPLTELVRFARGNYNPFNVCPYGGPITAYDPATDIPGGTPGALGIFLHALQDTYSHRDLGAADIYSHSKENYSTKELSGFVSGHFAGEFGLNDEGFLGLGAEEAPITILTAAGRYKVILHSSDTAEALLHSFDELSAWLRDPNFPDRRTLYGTPTPLQCTASQLEAFVEDFASIPNASATSSHVSGAQARSLLASSFARAKDCTWDAPAMLMPGSFAP